MLGEGRIGNAYTAVNLATNGTEGSKEGVHVANDDGMKRVSTFIQVSTSTVPVQNEVLWICVSDCESCLNGGCVFSRGTSLEKPLEKGRAASFAKLLLIIQKWTCETSTALLNIPVAKVRFAYVVAWQ